MDALGMRWSDGFKSRMHKDCVLAHVGVLPVAASQQQCVDQLAFWPTRVEHFEDDDIDRDRRPVDAVQHLHVCVNEKVGGKRRVSEHVERDGKESVSFCEIRLCYSRCTGICWDTLK